ncbi:MAG TPA: ATP-binding protein [Acetobacteraceae bacterium]|nr:ATP-binding protein [Acetobacteraceae bacterium]
MPRAMPCRYRPHALPVPARGPQRGRRQSDDQGLGSPLPAVAPHRGSRIGVRPRTQAEPAPRKTRADRAHAARLATIGQLTALIAHEVAQPLTALVSNAEACLNWLTRENPDLDEARRAAERIVGNGDRARRIVATIRGMAGKAPEQAVRFDLNEAIAGALALIASDLRHRGVRLETDLCDAPMPIVGSKIELQQVVLNLVMNGAEAMAALTRRTKTVRVSSVRAPGGGALVSVADVGTGVPPARMGRIFDAFFTTKPAGMGMGLALSRSIIEAHGGRLWASPQRPHGTVFQFILPTRDQPEGERKCKPPRPNPA